MCNFKSAIVLRDESVKGGFKLLLSPWTESHSELCIIHKLNDTAKAKLYFARVEFSPPSMDKAHLVETYKLKIDEERTPEWFDDEMKEKVTDRLRACIKSMIVDGNVQLLIGGQFIIAPGATVECAHSMVINAICGGTVSEIWGGTVSEIWGGTVSAIRGGTVSEIWGGTVSAIWGGTVSAINGGTVSAINGGTVSAISGGTVSAINGGTVSAIRGGTVSAIRGGTVSAISKWFNGAIGTIGAGATIAKDSRKKATA
jgi:hypothetical protein